MGPSARGKRAQAQGVQADEARSVLLVIGAAVVLKGDEGIGIKRFRRFAPSNGNVSLIELQPHNALDVLLAPVDQGLEHLALWGEPEAIINEFSIARHERVLEMGSLAVKCKAFHGAMGGMEDRAAGRLVDASRFHAYEPVFDQVDAPYAIDAAKIIQGSEECGRRERTAVECDGIALAEFDLSIGRLVRRIFGGNGALINIGRRLGPGVFEHLALRGGVKKIGIDGERSLAALVPGYRNLILFGEIDQVGAALERPFAPWSNDPDVGVQGIGGKLEANLVVALAGGTMGDGIGAGCAGDLYQPLGNQRAGNRGAEQIDALIKRIGAEHREDKVADEFL